MLICFVETVLNAPIKCPMDLRFIVVGSIRGNIVGSIRGNIVVSIRESTLHELSG
jgi:methyl coenzyme M reductase gamma subunit